MTLNTEEEYGPLLDLLGRSGLIDARPALARMGHPAAHYPRKVWAASHERAVIEMTWEQLHGPFGYRSAQPIPAFYFDDLPTLYPGPLLRLLWWAWRLRKVVRPEGAAVWETWRREWWDQIAHGLVSHVCVFRRMWIADFGGSGSPVSVEVDHRFRRKWIAFGRSGSPSFGGCERSSVA